MRLLASIALVSLTACGGAGLSGVGGAAKNDEKKESGADAKGGGSDGKGSSGTDGKGAGEDDALETEGGKDTGKDAGKDGATVPVDVAGSYLVGCGAASKPPPPVTAGGTMFGCAVLDANTKALVKLPVTDFVLTLTGSDGKAAKPPVVAATDTTHWHAFTQVSPTQLAGAKSFTATAKVDGKAVELAHGGLVAESPTGLVKPPIPKGAIVLFFTKKLLGPTTESGDAFLEKADNHCRDEAKGHTVALLAPSAMITQSTVTIPGRYTLQAPFVTTDGGALAANREALYSQLATRDVRHADGSVTNGTIPFITGAGTPFATGFDNCDKWKIPSPNTFSFGRGGGDGTSPWWTVETGSCNGDVGTMHLLCTTNTPMP